MSNASDSPRTDQPVIPADMTRASYHSGMGDLPLQQPHTTQQTRSSSESSGASLKSPRTARFAEATTVHSPIESSSRSPFADPPQRQSGGVADVGFGYVAANNPAQHAEDSRPPMTPALASPLRSGLKVPNTAKSLNPLSPTFREEYMLEKQEKEAEKENARDLVRKILRTHLQISSQCTMLINVANQTPGPHCEDLPPRRQLLMQPDRAGTTRYDADHIPRHQGPSLTQQSARMGRGQQPVGTVLATGLGLFLLVCVLDCLLGLLERRSPSS